MTADDWRTNERWEALVALAGGALLAAGAVINRHAFEGSGPGLSAVEFWGCIALAIALVPAAAFLLVHSLLGRAEGAALRSFGLVVGGAGGLGVLLGLGLAFGG